MSRPAAELAIAFDVATLDQALELDRKIGEGPEYAKIGLQLFTKAGPDAVRALRDRGRRVFLDLKLHDIPNTVRGAAASAAATGAELLTVHASGGEEMVRAAVEGIDSAGGRTKVVAVTLLTSLDPASMPPGFRQPLPMAEVQAEMLEMAERAGALGIVCSAADLAGIRERHPKPFYSVTPGIRPAGGASQDQKRVATIAEALELGASLLVLGRAITGALDPRLAIEDARAERDAVLR
jgi:orotidine-5'-phosphate decarboxylase